MSDSKIIRIQAPKPQERTPNTQPPDNIKDVTRDIASLLPDAQKKVQEILRNDALNKQGIDE